MSSDYPWYELVDQSAVLQQGDILTGCRMPEIPTDAPSAAVEGTLYPRVLVLTQSCDFAKPNGVERVMLCPLVEARELVSASANQGSTKQNLNRGRLVAHSLLSPCLLTGVAFPHLATDFASAFSVPVGYAQEIAQAAGARVRMLPPYREHVAQAFGMFYMRIGLPLGVEPLP